VGWVGGWGDDGGTIDQRGDVGSDIESLTLVDVSAGMLDVARGRWDEMAISIGGGKEEGGGGVRDVGNRRPRPPPVEFVLADATTELLSKFGMDAFDVVIDTFGLCVMGNEGARMCLREMTGVVRRGGELG
jgi:ubiquinone/menaquinone biosynthesis C-methylase UbiE